MLPVEVGLTLRPYCAISASSPAWLDDPVSEYDIVWPLTSLIDFTGEAAGTYQ